MNAQMLRPFVLAETLGALIHRPVLQDFLNVEIFKIFSRLAAELAVGQVIEGGVECKETTVDRDHTFEAI